MQIQSSDALQNWFARLNPRTYAILIGVAIGVVGGGVGLLIAIGGPIVAAAAVLGLLAGLYILTDVSAALYGFIVTMLLLPFGTMPFEIVFTPTLLDVTLGVFVLVYLFLWMTGKRRTLRLTPVHALLLLYTLWFILSFVLGLRYGSPRPDILRQFMETLLAISLTFILVDLLRDPKALRRLVFIIFVMVSVQSLVAIILYFLPDTVSENLLVRLARIGYPNGGVIRYIEDDPELAERAIGTWVDPNVLGGALAIFAAMIAPQIFARKPVIRYRWLSFLVLAVVGIALILTFSRAAMLAFVCGVIFIGVMRYRRFIPLMLIAGALLLLLPQTQEYIQRFGEAFALFTEGGSSTDLATQMRLGEYKDSFTLIGRYPIFGVGFTGTPDRDIYTQVASMYLIMMNHMGIPGLLLFLLTMLGVFVYGFRAWRLARDNPNLDAIWLGYHAALLAVLVNSVADMYFFRLDFQSPITLFWLTVALALASSRLALETAEDHALNPPLSKQNASARIAGVHFPIKE